MDQEQPLLDVKNLKKYFWQRPGIFSKQVNNCLKAVDGVDFSVFVGEIVSLVGESGCGKTTMGKTLLGGYQPTSGKVYLEGEDFFTLTGPKLLAAKRKIQMIFQDPFASLNPCMTIAELIREPLTIHRIATKETVNQKVLELLNLVGLNREHTYRYPHEFSGGQRQRIGIARALAVQPRLIICDEPVSALDISIQAQIINLLKDLQENLGLTYLLITHDLGVVGQISDRIAVMYLGKIVELASTTDFFKEPVHPYSQALLSAVPIADPDQEASRQRIVLTGDVPSALNPPVGCRFKSRCQQARVWCGEEEPLLKDCGGNRLVACFAVNGR